MDKLKQELIDDYSNWIDQALCTDGRTMVDSLGIKQIAVENFGLKLDKLINYVNKANAREISDAGNRHSGQQNDS